MEPGTSVRLAGRRERPTTLSGEPRATKMGYGESGQFMVCRRDATAREKMAMAEKSERSDWKEERVGENKDIAPVLKGWDYESGSINVRKVAGVDGREKLQMRLDLGLLQMEVQGRPDGARPHGRESFLEYFEEQLAEHKRGAGNDDEFALDGDQCQQLREEAVMYYHRYISLFILGDFPGVVRDTSRNLRVLDFCGEYATDESDRFVLEQYRPYIIMMNTRARASLQFKD